ncbi:MAG TPA: GAF domain-containing protein, partial [Phototrophicaceae bacterium]|nr:GAF domain-containing protein [Phototrophicaceae bacterium]
VQNARIFIVDNNGTEAVLKGDSGQPDLTEAKQVEYGVGGLTTVGQSILQERHIIARPGESPVVEAVFPLRIGNRIIGALELRSVNNTIYARPSVINAFQSLADNLSLAIDNVLQYERAEQRVKENEALVNQARDALGDVERLNQRLTGNIWSQYLRSLEEGVGMSVDFQEGDTQSQAARGAGQINTPWTSALSNAFQNNHLVQEQKEDLQVIAVPLRVRGQVIGAMEFEIDSQRGFTPEDMELLQEVSERFGMAADNTRLLEESSLVARREALVNQISTRLQSASSVNATLIEAARGLREALKAGKVAIRLGTPGSSTASMPPSGMPPTVSPTVPPAAPEGEGLS